MQSFDAWFFAGHHQADETASIRHAIRDVRVRLRVPSDLDEAGAREWLERISLSRGAEHTRDELERDVGRIAARRRGLPAEAVVSTARRIHRWREELIHGRVEHP